MFSYSCQTFPDSFNPTFTQITEEFDRNYWVGPWHAEGYRCNDKTPAVEEVEIRMEGDTFIATKTLGDDCVLTGQETFRGTLPADNKNYNSNDRVSVVYKTGYAGSPSSGQANLTLQIIDKNTFKGGMTMNITYRRAEVKKPEPKPVAISDPAPEVQTKPKPIAISEPVPAEKPRVPRNDDSEYVLVPANFLRPYFQGEDDYVDDDDDDEFDDDDLEIVRHNLRVNLRNRLPLRRRHHPRRRGGRC